MNRLALKELSEMPETKQNEKAPSKWLRRIFVVIGVLFINYHVGRLWLDYKAGQDLENNLKRRMALKKNPEVAIVTDEAGNKHEDPRGLRPDLLPEEQPGTETPPKTEEAAPKDEEKIVEKPAPKSEPVKVLEKKEPSVALKAKPVEAAPIFHLGQSRVYAYFINGKNQTKVDLFYDLFPDKVNDFISEVVRCRDSHKNQGSINMNIKWIAKVIAPDHPPSSDYIGFMFRNDIKNNQISDLLLAQDPTKDIPKDFKLLGGVISMGNFERKHGSDENVVFNKSEVLLTFIENEDTNKLYGLFKSALDHIKAGCPK